MNLKLNQAIRHILLAGAATAMTVGTFGLAQAAVGVQIQPPGPGQVPDYFGVSSNYATSPTPNFALVTITPNGAGAGAVAAATTVDYLNPNYGITPAGMYTNNLMDVQLFDGGSGYTAATTVTVAGYSAGQPTSVSLTPIIVNGVIAGFSEIPHAQVLTDDSGTTYPAWTQDTGTGQWLLQTYDAQTTSWTTVGVDGTGPYWVGLGASTDANGHVVSTKNVFTQPIPGTGIRKFVNDVSLPGTTNNLGQTLSVADPSVYGTPFPVNGNTPEADYYEIAEVAYTQQMHSDLPPTHLRGYIQLVPSNTLGAKDIKSIASIQLDAAVPGSTYYVLGAPSYLGPVIVAQKNKPVRVKAVNLLPTGAAGALPFPVDHTYMGAGAQDATGLLTGELPDTRTAIHLHGGTTPWISDGTPRQWFTPKGEAGASRGVSATDVPDMWFDASGNLINDPTCQGKTICAIQGATNNPGAGALTFYYTNEESARLMFYHDHAEGVTRLNVYGGMAAGYILQDPTEQAMTHGNAAKNGVASSTVGSQTYAEVLPEDFIPIVIQEKTFVPDNTKPVLTFYGPFRSQLNSQDPTWRWGSNGQSWDGVTGGFLPYGQFAGTTDPSPLLTDLTGVTYANGPGDLWVPHVYMTNQNPGDVSGANPQGRWDYGSWFWPPSTVIDHPQVTNPYYDAACTSANITNPVGTCESKYIPGFPNGGQMPAGTTAVNCAVTQNGKGVSIKNCTATGVVTPVALAAMNQSSGTPEAFNDTAVVNGTVYPYMNVEPKKYRLRFLSAGNDRAWNLSLWVASSKNVDTTSEGNSGATSTAATGAVCNAANAINPANCTEVRMVPWNATQNVNSKFPAWWYTTLKGGITFDGRPGGVPDPKTRGPAMVQIGTEGGFLAEPAVIKNQPVNFEFNVKNILVTNVKEHALLIGPAERADVVVDFSQFAGSTLIMYNDAPAALPAYDLRLDYFTGGFDNTDTGGTFQTVPGYGPNTRTVMQFRVAASCPDNSNCGTGVNRGAKSLNPVDDVDSTWLSSLTTEVHKAFKFSQEPIVVPQAAYNNTYGTNVADATGQNISAIGDSTLSFTPFNSIDPVTGAVTFEASAVTLGMEPKAIQELFTQDYGRMNATLGTEIPFTTSTTQTTIPLGYVEPPTELVQMTKDNPNLVIGGNIGQLADGTQIWKITHNGVDTHPIHFHLFSVQLLNRVGWDGAIYNPEANEIGWKEVLRMNPLSDVIVALRPKTLTLPFKLGNSHHIADATQADGATANQPNLDPTTGNASTVVNRTLNYGWEYVWHCHILGHEENDFMRSIAVAQVPDDPTIPVVSQQANGDNIVSWTDNSVVSNWVTIERSADSDFKNLPAAPTTAFSLANPLSVGGYNAYGECLSQTGCARTWTDNAANVPAGTVFYRVIAKSTVGAGDIHAKLPVDLDKTTILPKDSAGATGVGFLGYDNVTASSSETPASNGVLKLVPVASIPATLAFNPQLQGVSTTQTVTLSNTGNMDLTINSIVLGGTNANQFTIGNGCGATLAAGATCPITVNFLPTSAGAKTATITVTDNSNLAANSTQVVTLSGTGVIATGTLTPVSNNFGTIVTGLSTSPATLFTLTNTTAFPITLTAIPTLIGANNQFAIASNTCTVAASLAANNGTCTVGVIFKPTTNGTKNATLSVALPNGGVTQTAALTGIGASGAVGVLTINPASFGNTALGLTNTAIATLRNNGNLPLQYSTITATGAGFTVTGGSCVTNGNKSVANGNSCNINLTFAPTGGLNFVSPTTFSGVLSIADNSGVIGGGGAQTTTQTLALTGNGVISAVNDTQTTQASTGASQTINQNVRVNDTPASGTVALVSNSFTNGGALAVASIVNNQVRWILTAPATAVTNATRQASKRGTYTAVYSLTSGGVTVQATAILTVN
jgi:FtsP/CotA-like multicopper oxidase with cupredoxin domain